LIDVEGVSKKYANHTVLDDISFSVSEGEIFSILGPNGAGKSTAVKIMSACLPFTEGRINIAGYDVKNSPTDVKKYISVVGQSVALDENMSARENLEFFSRLMGMKKSSALLLIDQQLDRFGIRDVENKAVKNCSGGMKRRLDLAVALLTVPKVLFLDEPTTGLDPASRRDIWDIIRDLKQKNTTVILTTQYLEEADQLADNVILIDEGKIKAQGHPESLKQQFGQLSCGIQPVVFSDIYKIYKILSRYGHSVIDEEGACVNMLLDNGIKAFIEIIKQIDQADIKIADIKLFRPSLDDVFHAITQNVVHKQSNDNVFVDTESHCYDLEQGYSTRKYLEKGRL